MFLNVNNTFSLFQYTGHQPNSVGDLGRSINQRKTFDIVVSTKSEFCKFRFGEGGLQLGSPPLGAPTYLTQDSKVRYRD